MSIKAVWRADWRD